MKLMCCAALAGAILFLPVHAHLLIRFDREMIYQIRLRVMGWPWLVVRKKTFAQSLKTNNDGLLSEWSASKSVWFSVLINQGFLKKLCSVFRWHHIELEARIALQDASLTALVYTLLTIVLQICRGCSGLEFKKKIQVSFRGEGTMAMVSCIASTHLGKLAIAAVRMWTAAAGEKARRRKAKEEEYAASH